MERRAVVEALARQEDEVVEKRGPSLDRAFADGKPTKAAEGFARGQGVDVADLEERDGYVYAVKRVEGRPTPAVLPELLAQFMDGLRGMGGSPAKLIADMAETYYIPVATHNVAGPIATIASANFAASVREFVAHEAFISNPINRDGHGINGDPEVLGYDKEMIVNGHIQLSDRPGFGIELNEKLIREKYLVDGEQMWS